MCSFPTISVFRVICGILGCSREWKSVIHSLVGFGGTDTLTSFLSEPRDLAPLGGELGVGKRKKSSDFLNSFGRCSPREHHFDILQLVLKNSKFLIY